ncbi:MAG: 1-deoxy-D-xylulose-5-phosphate reductoisomerase, partial [Clostridia bacterium]|nr:1-deoxy-D-xylulose-5-phosphate reductoisomerase [Clostridia bacterium]
LCELVSETNAGTVVNALSGMRGLKPTLAALDAGKPVALANKETLVAGGDLVMKKAGRTGNRILPVDSEHSAVFQCLSCGPEGKEPPKIRRILLTASGGPFFGKDRAFLERVTPDMALRHPNWSMGPKVTVDSSTLMNKGLELIEAVHLFGVRPEQVEVVVHRESVIHSMVEFEDRAVLAQMAVPDMRLCIQYALTYPERKPSLCPELDLFSLTGLTFHRPDEETFPLLALARKAILEGGNRPAAMNGANEAAVALFLKGQIRYTDIFERVAFATESAAFVPDPSLEDILRTDREARRAAAGTLEETD